MVQQIRNRVAKQMGYLPLLLFGNQTQTDSACPKRPINHISMTSKPFKMYCWFRLNQLLSGSWRIQVVSVFGYSENGLQLSPLLDRKKGKSSATRFNHNQYTYIYLRLGHTKTKSCEMYRCSGSLVWETCSPISSDWTGDVNNCSQRPFATFGNGVPQSKLIICLLIMIDTSGGALCFLPIQERRKQNPFSE